MKAYFFKIILSTLLPSRLFSGGKDSRVSVRLATENVVRRDDVEIVRQMLVRGVRLSILAISKRTQIKTSSPKKAVKNDVSAFPKILLLAQGNS